MVSLDHVRIGRWGPIGLLGAAFSIANLMSRSTVMRLHTVALVRLLERIGRARLLTGELSIARLASDGAIIHLAALRCRPTVRHTVVRSARATLMLAIGDVLVVVFGIVEDDVPSVDHAGQDAEAAECDVDDGVSTADTSLNPYCITLSVWLRDGQRNKGLLGPWVGSVLLTSNGRKEKGKEHEETVGAAHVGRWSECYDRCILRGVPAKSGARCEVEWCGVRRRSTYVHGHWNKQAPAPGPRER